MSWMLLAAKVVLLWLRKTLTTEAEKKEQRKECLNDAKKAIKAKDPSAITTAFNRANRL